MTKLDKEIQEGLYDPKRSTKACLKVRPVSELSDAELWANGKKVFQYKEGTDASWLVGMHYYAYNKFGKPYIHELKFIPIKSIIKTSEDLKYKSLVYKDLKTQAPPVDVTIRDGKYRLFDGHKRLAAAKARGDKCIFAEIHHEEMLRGEPLKVFDPKNRQKAWEKELKTKAHEGKKLKGQQKLTSAVSTSKRLSEFAYDTRPSNYVKLEHGDMVMKDGLIVQKTLPGVKTTGLKSNYKIYGKINAPSDVLKFVSDMENYDREYAKVLHLDTKNNVVGVETVSIGSLNAAITHPREIFKKAVLDNSASIVFVHNHPSGDPTPSNEDKNMMVKLQKTGEIIGISLLDSVVVGRGQYYSFKESGAMIPDAKLFDIKGIADSLRRQGIEPDLVDIEGEYDHNLSHSENLAHFKDMLGLGGRRKQGEYEAMAEQFYKAQTMGTGKLAYASPQERAAAFARMRETGTLRGYDPASAKFYRPADKKTGAWLSTVWYFSSLDALTAAKMFGHDLKTVKIVKSDGNFYKNKFIRKESIATYDPKGAAVYIITDSKDNKHKATYAQWLKWMKEQKRPYDPNTSVKVGSVVQYKGVKYRVVNISKNGTQSIQQLTSKGVPIGRIYQSSVLFDPKSSPSPPTRWYEAMVKGIKKSSDVRNPYAIVKSIWAKLSPSGKAKIKAREAKGEHFKYDLPLPVDKPTKGIGTVRMVKPFNLAEVQVNLSVRDYLTALSSGIFSKMKRQDGTTALVARCKSPVKNVNIFVDKAGGK